MPAAAESSLTDALAISMVIYTIVVFAIAFWSRARIANDEDYVVAGRRLSFPLATATLLATWFGAGTLLATTDNVRKEGLREIALEPLGPGICLLIAALLFARPLWEAKILTIVDFYREKYGPRTELLANIYQFSFFPWIATQLLGISGILELFFGMDRALGLCLVAAVAMLYTLIGGMWSVTLTDALQLVLLVVGLVMLGFSIFSHLGDGSPVDGVGEIIEGSSAEDLVIVPTESLREFFHWLSLFLAGTIGIIPGQDLMQRIFSSRSSRIAVGACVASGLAYIVLGAFPVLSGLAGKLLLEEDFDGQVLPELARLYLSPPLAIVFVLTLMSTILSSLDSAILAPSSIFAQNFLRRFTGEDVSVERLTQACVVAVTAVSLALALGGEDAFRLLEASYALGLAPVVILTFGLLKKKTHEIAGLLTLSVGLVLWGGEITVEQILPRFAGMEWEPVVPFPVLTFFLCLVTYVLSDAWAGRRGRG